SQPAVSLEEQAALLNNAVATFKLRDSVTRVGQHQVASQRAPLLRPDLGASAAKSSENWEKF
ncbi:MAG: methyl-accepting chemotaxis protein, partial [Ewingella sp.]|nr:methyl-accepting chemotaxis protein [Ewingella sp.]